MEAVHLTALALFVLFGANWVLYGCLWLHERLSQCKPKVESTSPLLGQAGAGHENGAVAAAPAAATGAGAGHGKVMSEPLSRTLSSVRNFSRELARLGALITFAYVCEHHPPFPHNKKEHDMDMFWCMALVLFVASMLNVRKSKGGDVLNREQTEEWKGWMQFMFLNYHYFYAHEVYNAIRVFITAYVWMTGFGNFSFFYLKGDYSMVRLLQMLWRLNFLVFFLVMIMDNHYILYYICPLHTFYFLMVYVIMRPVQSANYTKSGMRWKLALAALFISAVWDWDIGLFDKVFWFLGRDKIVGAGSGTMWEWYFRTSLDHWSTFLGMIFALNYPSTALWVRKVEAMPRERQWLIKGSAAALLMGAAAWWAKRVLPLEKYDYNQKNAYFGVAIPVLTYIFMRNLTPLMRTRYLEPLHSLGKITLETYLMQHHVWLTSNAKTLLVFVPGLPKVNLILVGCSYVLVSRELYRLTMSLRGMCLPDNLGACLRNLCGIAMTIGGAVCVAALLRSVEAGAVACVCVIGLLGFCAALFVHLLLRGTAGGAGGTEGRGSCFGGGGGAGGLMVGGSSGKEYDRRLLNAAHTGPVLVAVMAVMAAAAAWAPSSSPSPADSMSTPNVHDACVETVNHGMWKVDSGACQDPEQAGALCNSHEWKWMDVPDQCQFHYLPPADVASVLSGQRVVVVGDSVQRFVYYSLIRSLGYETPAAHDTSLEKHSDFSWPGDGAESKTSIDFLWAPLADNLASRVADVYANEKFDVLLMGGGLWDALYTKGNVDAYAEGLAKLRTTLSREPSVAHHPLTMWVKTTHVVPGRLTTDEKKEWLTEDKLKKYRKVVDSSDILSSVDGIVDGLELTKDQRGESYDGVHYTDLIYDAFAQVTANLVRHYGRFTTAPTSSNDDTERKAASKPITGMGNYYLGLMVLFLAAVMVLSRDAFHGVARLALSLFGGPFFDPKTMDWESTYGSLLRKIGKHPDGTSGGGRSSSNNHPNTGTRSNGTRADGIEAGESGGTGAGVASKRTLDDDVVMLEEAESLLLEARSRGESGIGLEMKHHASTGGRGGDSAAGGVSHK